MGIVCSIIALVEAIDVIALASAAASAIAAITEVAAGVAAELVADAIGVGGLDVLAEAGVDWASDAAISEAEKVLVRQVASKVIAKLSGKYGLSYNNLLKVFGKSYENIQKKASAVKLAHTAAVAALHVCCQDTTCKGTTKAKCPTETNRRSLSETNRREFPMWNGLGANTDYEFPTTIMCGKQEQIVRTFDEAKRCYANTLKNMRLQMEMSKNWRAVAQHECNVLLYGATEDPNDEYCTVFRVPHSSTVYENEIISSNRTTKSIYLSDMPYCASLEMATKSMLLAAKIMPPDGLMPFIWAPRSNCTLARPGVRVSQINPMLPAPNDDTNDVVWYALAVVIAVLVAVVAAAIINIFMHRSTHKKLDKMDIFNANTQREEDADATYTTPLKSESSTTSRISFRLRQ